MQLDTVRVLDLTRLLPGPYATQLLCDAGADVIKIEDTDRGDYARYMPPMTARGVGSVFDAVNRGKKSIGLDLKTDGGREAFYRLLDNADVVIESFRPGVTERLGIGYETVREQNPSIVYCSLSGYGQTGPLADRAGHDLNYVGRAGLLDMTRGDEDTPVVPGYQVADMSGGLFAAFAIVGALCSRELGDGTGEYIDVGMTDVVLSFAQSLTAGVFSEKPPRPGETPLTGGLPWYDIYETADGKHVTLAALEPQFWRAFCRAIDRDDLRDEHMTSDPAARQALREELDSIFGDRTRAEWVKAFDDVDATVDGVYTPNEAVESVHCRARGLIQDDTAPPRIGFPAVCELPASDESIPDHGEHTDELLRAANYDETAIERLRETGVIT
ncbi:CaiB/BaiF CoA transferase family protein [Halocatena salina]|uniref:CoA transferase n=1 Tax=Halocatena salina TaxID=2934340 RepID=A0A8U0A8T2_9EURY|nr:CaiB/BaiF CoA-transferase family protein [Halocatena salina]UPM44433.1 CoA transferase [Halocatena salina]